MSKVYPKCESCCESQRRECNRKADSRLWMHGFIDVFLAVAGILSLVFGVPLAAVFLGGILAIDAFFMCQCLRRMQSGGKLVHLLGCCYKMRH